MSDRCEWWAFFRSWLVQTWFFQFLRRAFVFIPHNCHHRSTSLLRCQIILERSILRKPYPANWDDLLTWGGSGTDGRISVLFTFIVFLYPWVIIFCSLEAFSPRDSNDLTDSSAALLKSIAMCFFSCFSYFSSSFFSAFWLSCSEVKE